MPDQFLNAFMDQCWEDLLLLHWPVEGELVRKNIPDDLEVDLFDGQAWLSVVGFQLTGLKISPFRWLSWPGFWEINLRTYVRDRYGNKGIWFYSLDSSDPLAVSGARMLYGLPYNYARTEGWINNNKISFFSRRSFPHTKAESQFEATFKSSPKQTLYACSELDRFLLERYRFWSRRKLSDTSSSAQVMHIPYRAVLTDHAKYEGELFSSQGFSEPTERPSRGHYCRGFAVQASAPSWIFSIAGQANQR
jgi:uncharacterized protein YqjF (DUF2071 family)